MATNAASDQHVEGVLKPLSSLTTSSNNTLITLPAEVRETILKQLLVLPFTLHGRGDGNLPVGTCVRNYRVHIMWKPTCYRGMQVQLLRVCRLLHCEGAAVLYGLNIFCVWELLQWYHRSRLEAWLEDIGAANCRLIKHVDFGTYDPMRTISWAGLNWLFLSRGWDKNFPFPVNFQEEMSRSSNFTSVQFSRYRHSEEQYGLYPVLQPVKKVIRGECDPVLKGKDDHALWHGLPGIDTTALLLVKMSDLMADSSRTLQVYHIRESSVWQTFVITKEKFSTDSQNGWTKVDIDEMRKEIHHKETEFRQQLEKEGSRVEEFDANLQAEGNVEMTKCLRMCWWMLLDRPAGFTRDSLWG